MRIPSQKHHFSNRLDINKDDNTHWRTPLRIIAPKTKVDQSKATNNSLSLTSTNDDNNKDFPFVLPKDNTKNIICLERLDYLFDATGDEDVFFP